MDWAVTLNLAIVCFTALTALGMFRGSVRSVAENRKHFVFVLNLPLKIRWTFAGGEDATQVNRIVDSIEVPGASGEKTKFAGSKHEHFRRSTASESLPSPPAISSPENDTASIREAE